MLPLNVKIGQRIGGWGKIGQHVGGETVQNRPARRGMDQQNHVVAVRKIGQRIGGADNLTGIRRKTEPSDEAFSGVEEVNRPACRGVLQTAPHESLP